MVPARWENAAVIPTEPPELLIQTAKCLRGHTVTGYRRDYLGNRFIYVTMSPRARGLSVGVNLSPDKRCNFACVYCDVDRAQPGESARIDLEVLARELGAVLALAREGKLRARPAYQHIPAELCQVQEVALGGEGEPTLSPQFAEAMQILVHTRAVSPPPFFKLVLMTNASSLDTPAVKEGLHHLTFRDEVWVKLDAGTQSQMNIINRTNLTLKKILANIQRLGCQRPIVIQSLFPCFQGQGLSSVELEQYICRLSELKSAGAQITLVQVYSAQQPTAHPQCGHLPLPSLTYIAQRIHEATGLTAQVF